MKTSWSNRSSPSRGKGNPAPSTKSSRSTKSKTTKSQGKGGKGGKGSIRLSVAPTDQTFPKPSPAPSLLEEKNTGIPSNASSDVSTDSRDHSAFPSLVPSDGQSQFPTIYETMNPSASEYSIHPTREMKLICGHSTYPIIDDTDIKYKITVNNDEIDTSCEVRRILEKLQAHIIAY